MIWDEHTYLMVDPNLVAEEENTSMVREEAFKHEANPIMRLTDKPLTLSGRATSLGFIELVVKENGTYRMWYQIRGVRQQEEKQPRATGGRHHDTPSSRHNKEAYIGYAESQDGICWKPVCLEQVKVRGAGAESLQSWPRRSKAQTRWVGASSSMTGSQSSAPPAIPPCMTSVGSPAPRQMTCIRAPPTSTNWPRGG